MMKRGRGRRGGGGRRRGGGIGGGGQGGGGGGSGGGEEGGVGRGGGGEEEEEEGADALIYLLFQVQPSLARVRLDMELLIFRYLKQKFNCSVQANNTLTGLLRQVSVSEL